MEDLSDEHLLTLRPTVPEHVVERAFQGESVVLNLKSGQYHGLNAVGVRMFESLRTAPTVGDAVASLSEEFGQPREMIERDLTVLVGQLSSRGLVELESGIA
jgi:hypothetical protein